MCMCMYVYVTVCNELCSTNFSMSAKKEAQGEKIAKQVATSTTCLRVYSRVITCTRREMLTLMTVASNTEYCPQQTRAEAEPGSCFFCGVRAKRAC